MFAFSSGILYNKTKQMFGFMGEVAMKKISERQQQILDYITDFTATEGYPPSVREICNHVGLSSPSSVQSHLDKLRAAGYLQKADGKMRTAVVCSAPPHGQIPILGKVAAGMPILAVEQAEGYLPYEKAGSYGERFALRIQGDSMIGAGILDGDYIVVRKASTARSGQIVVALLEDEATCKTLIREDGHIWLRPENDAYPLIDGTGCSLIGVVESVIRNYDV